MITPAKDQYTFPHHNTKNSLNKALFFIILDGGKAVWRVTDRKESFPERYGGSMKRKLMMANGEERPTKKPDIDNVVKVYADALNHLAYHDDSQVVSITCEKYYSEEPRVEVILSDAEEEL